MKEKHNFTNMFKDTEKLEPLPIENDIAYLETFTNNNAPKQTQTIVKYALNIIQRLQDEKAEQKFEIERLTECLKLEQGKRLDLHIENSELQKQVDELTKKCERYHNANLDSAKNGYASGYYAGKRDATKEIFAELFYIASIHHSDVANILAWAKEKAKSVSVEVAE